jgi:hypothetical protein
MPRFIACAILLAVLCFVLGQALIGMARSMTLRTALAMSGLLCAAVLAVALSLDWIADERPSRPSKR